MRTIPVKSWREFESQIAAIRSEYSAKKKSADAGHMLASDILFRGQGDAAWPLLTTLERKSSEKFDVSQYVNLVARTQYEVGSFTGRDWRVPNGPELTSELRKNEYDFRVYLPAYDYLVHLRHHGFPSPLLDWTESPYVAAYFAFMDSRDADRAVYCYVERPSGTKTGAGGDPMITLKGPFVSTHKRHFAQRAWYTVATTWDDSRRIHVFSKHEDVFRRGDESQDVLIKIVLPSSARADALEALNDYNINHFTLFQSEDALIKALEMKYFDLRGL